MSQDPLPCPPQMRNDGLPRAHLSPSPATLLGLPHWLAPPQCAPELLTPECASWVATFAKANFDAILSKWMIALYQEGLAQYAEQAARTQQVEATQSATLAKWQRQEDAVQVQLLTTEADMHHRQNDTLHTITNGFAINLDILAVRVASWNGVEDVLVLLVMRQHEDNTQMQRFHDNHAATAARAPWKAATRANVLVASCHQEGKVHTRHLPP
jgi:hypothetical protein